MCVVFLLQQFTLGITSLSKVGPIGAAIEVLIIFYLCATSTVGLYTMPFMQSIRPQRHKTSLSQLIVNGALVLILSSALPLLSRILGMPIIYCHSILTVFYNPNCVFFPSFLSFFSFLNWLILIVINSFAGITNFDLLGDFGEIEWLGNFQIVLLYNIIFVDTTTMTLVNKFTATVRQELCNRLVENYIIFTNYVSFINWFNRTHRKPFLFIVS